MPLLIASLLSRGASHCYRFWRQWLVALEIG